jgi:hypothetical protein
MPFAMAAETLITCPRFHLGPASAPSPLKQRLTLGLVR